MKKSIALLLLILAIIVPSCSDESIDELKLVVSCTDGTFSGTYWIDGGSATDLSGTQVNTETFVYEGIFENVDTLVLNVTKSAGSASLYVYIYINDDLVTNESLTANYPSSTDPTLQLEVIYQKSSSSDTSSDE